MTDEWYRRREAEGMDVRKLIRTPQQEDEEGRRYEITDPLAIGARPLPGQRGETHKPKNPLCRDKCTTKGRAKDDSPAKFAVSGGRRLLYCPCCQRELIWSERLNREQRRYMIDNIRPAALNPALTATHRRFCDLICDYDVVVLKDLVEVK